MPAGRGGKAVSQLRIMMDANSAATTARQVVDCLRDKVESPVSKYRVRGEGIRR